MLTSALVCNLVRKRERVEVTGWRCNKVCAASWEHSCRSHTSDRRTTETRTPCSCAYFSALLPFSLRFPRYPRVCQVKPTIGALGILLE